MQAIIKVRNLLRSRYHTHQRDRKLRDCDPRGSLHKLPPELILHILDFLPPGSHVCVAITCRPFYELLGPRFPHPQTNGLREEFLQLLERDKPGWYFCFGCVQLHPWDHERPSFAQRWPEVCADFVVPNPMLGIASCEPVGYSDARLVMRRHHLGPEYGLPPTQLEQDLSVRKRTESGVRIEFKRTARIINDELFLLTEGEFWHPRGDTYGVQHHLESNKLCNHISMKPRSRQDSPFLNEVHELTRNPGIEYQPCKGVSASCPWCLTDYTVSITWAKRGAMCGWVVDTRAYHQLGPCESPFEWKWRAMSERSFFNEPRCRRYPPGVVKALWHSADLAHETTEGAPRPEEDQPCDRFIGPLRGATPIMGDRRCRWYTPNHNNHNCTTVGRDRVWSKRGWGHDM